MKERLKKMKATIASLKAQGRTAFMQLRGRRFRLSVDGAILAIATLMFSTSMFFLLHDGILSSDSLHGELTPVGHIANSRNDVRRKVDSGISWSQVGNHDVVYEGDSIFTGDESAASVELDSGGKINLDAKSLLVVHTNGQRVEVDLQYGSMHGKVNGDKPIVLVNNGQVQELTGKDAEIRVVKDKTNHTRVQVLKGEVKLKNYEAKSEKPAQTVSVKQDEVVQLAPKKAVEVKHVNISLQSPANGSRLWLEPNAPLGFKWKFEGGKKGRFEISRDDEFAKPMFAADVSGSGYTLPGGDRPLGTFYWRVRSLEDASAEVIPSSVTVFPDVPPVPLTPNNDQTLTLDADHGETARPIYLTWDDKASSVSWRVQVSHSADFKDKPVFDEKSTTMSLRTVALKSGEYYWRVLGQHPERKSEKWSRAMHLSIREGTKVPQAPVLASTFLSYTIPLDILSKADRRAIEHGRGVRPDNITPLAWAKMANVPSYEVEVSTDSEFKASVRQTTGADTKFAPQEVKPGSVFMRVRARGVDGRQSPPSETARLTVLTSAPPVQQVKPVVKTFTSKAEADKAKHEFNFNWKSLPFASSYELEWGADPTFKKSKTFNTTNSTRSIIVSKPMDYAYRVRALDANGAPISPYSPPMIASFKKQVVVPVAVKPVPTPKPIEKRPASVDVAGLAAKGILPPPALREPRPNTPVISLEKAMMFVSFRWQAITGAQFYTLQISSTPDFSQVIAEQRVSKTALAYEKKLPPGRIYWRVRAQNTKGVSAWSDVFDLNVMYQ